MLLKTSFLYICTRPPSAAKAAELCTRRVSQGKPRRQSLLLSLGLRYATPHAEKQRLAARLALTDWRGARETLLLETDWAAEEMDANRATILGHFSREKNQQENLSVCVKTVYPLLEMVTGIIWLLSVNVFFRYRSKKQHFTSRAILYPGPFLARAKLLPHIQNNYSYI